VKPKRPITVRDVFCHTTGYSYGSEPEVKKYYGKEGLTSWGPSGMYPAKMTIEKVAEALARIPALHHPGERFTYGYNTDLLGRLIEIWSGKPLDQYMREAIFEPLQMVDTGFSVPKEKRHRLAACHSTQEGKLVVIDPAAKSPFQKGFPFLSGGGGLLSTAGDYANFCQMIVNGGEFRGKRILKPATIALMFEDQLKGVGGPLKFGLGFAINKVKVGNGSAAREAAEYAWGGYASTSFRIMPGEKLFQIILRQHIPPAFALNEQLIRQVYAGITLPPAARKDAFIAPKVPDDVTFRRADILSEGTRMAAEVFAPKKPRSDKLPTIIMSHGWGGTAQMLRPDAIAFAKAGYLVIAFDYRGWGNSDARLVLAGKKPQMKEGKLIAEVKEVRGVVDPLDQTTDIMNAIHWAVGEKQCDPDRIGLWGSSYSGGHVVYVAARDPRVKAFVSQVGSLDSRWAVNSAALRKLTYGQGTARTHGKIGYPKPGEKFGPLIGAPVIEKLAGYAPIEDIGRCKNCAKLFIIAEKEELFDNKEHAILAHERATGTKKLVTIKGIKHYGVYREARGQAQKEAIAWFDEHLKGKE
jgi:CubicO group peptidase (beta-lactamase class C family)/dienelactone hydrolase